MLLTLCKDVGSGNALVLLSLNTTKKAINTSTDPILVILVLHGEPSRDSGGTDADMFGHVI